ncbi:Lrp/AsnC family transcriptional regulator [Pseudovibrio brasiliensis]|uniref:siroheme decarboxylase n=1 Tax=Pseudovibrio brasiliensis TaxID=1898042 RepID=A0ABX8AU14_9HYPH|nr:Lrp/AsnC family transcriptional regulator [Pseudovibrio brasiliensis]QUS58544.1 Lrp/AsnC family transcriptional regulator [Pseudovibrio brasiliensis]
MSAQLSDIDLVLVDKWQHNFPLVPKPFNLIARETGVDALDAISSYERLVTSGVISRIGAVLAPNTVSASCLAAVSAPPHFVETAAQIINDEPGVNHNYLRENDLNIWFVVVERDRATLEATLARIEQNTNLVVHAFRMEKAFHLDLGFSLTEQRLEKKTPVLPPVDMSVLEPGDIGLLEKLSDGIPLSDRPFLRIALKLGRSETSVLERLKVLQDAGIIRRFGVVVRHRSIGYKANAMSVWNVRDEHIDDVGAMFSADPMVSLCYQRNREMPLWPYNLYTMTHANSREEALEVINRLSTMATQHVMSSDVLFSTKCFKQRGARLSHSVGVSA